MSVMTISVWLLIVAATLVAVSNLFVFGKKAIGTFVGGIGIAVSTAVAYFTIGQTATIATIIAVFLAFVMIWLMRKNTITRQRHVAAMAVAVLAVGGILSSVLPKNEMPVVNMVSVSEDREVQYELRDYTPKNETAQLALEIKATWSKPEPVTYFANQAEPGTNNFGPRQSFETVRDGAFRLGEKLVKDALYLATIQEVRAHGKNAQQSVIHQQAEMFASNRPMQHAAAYSEIDAIDSIAISDFGDARYESLGMIQKKDGSMPTLTAFSTQQYMGDVLVIKYKDGTGILLRIDCDLQPSFFTKFTNISRYKGKEKTPTQEVNQYKAPPVGNGNPPSPTPKTSTPPSGGGNPPPPSTTHPAPTTTPTSTPPTTQPSTPQSTTPTSTPPTTQPSTPPADSGAKKPDAGPAPAPGHEDPAPAPKQSEAEEVLPAPTPDVVPVKPELSPSAPMPGNAAPDVDPVVPQPEPPAPTPKPAPLPDLNNSPSNPEVEINDPGPIAPAPEPPAPAPVQEAPAPAPAPAPEPPAPAPVQPVEAPANEEPAVNDAPSADTAEDTAPSVDNSDIATVAFSYSNDNWLSGVAVLAALVAIACMVKARRRSA